MLKLYYCRLPEKDPTLTDELISSYRAEKLREQRNPLVRRQSLYSELLLRCALKKSGLPTEYPLDIAVSENGKPFLRNESCRFNLSHSSQMALCALCDREIGADVQIKSKARPALIERFFSDEEKTYVFGSADMDATFTEIWVKKESFCKLDGRGLTLPFASFSVFDKKNIPLFWHTTAGDYHFALCSDSIRSEIPELIEIDASVLLQ